MLNPSSIIASFVLVSLLVVGGVELFCRNIGQLLPVEQEVEVAAAAQETGRKIVPRSRQTKPSVKGRNSLAGQDYAIITRRSLFGKLKSQEEPVKVEQTPQPLQETTLNLVLLGTISGQGNVQRAIIQDKTKKTQDIYYKGDAIGSAIIKQVNRGAIIITVNGKDEVLRMEELKSSPATGKEAGRSQAFFTPVPGSNTYKESQKKAALKKAQRKTKSAYPKRKINWQLPKKRKTEK